MQLSIIFTLAFFVFLVVRGLQSKIQNRNSKLPPRPWKLPLIGHLHHLIGPLPHRTLKDLAKKHGHLMFLQLGEVPSIIVSSPRIAKEILKTNDLAFANRGAIFTANIVTYGSIGVSLSPYGEHWKQLRKVCTLELLSAKKVQSFMSVREEEVGQLVEALTSLVGSPVNMSQKIFSLINDITCRVAFGKKCKERESFLSMMMETIELSSGFEMGDIYPSFKFLHGISGVKHRSEKIHQKMDKILDDIMNEHRLNRKDKFEEDFVDVLLRIQEDNDPTFPIEDNCIKAIILEVFIAGTDTSSTTLEWALSELIRNPRVMKKAQSEVRRVFDAKKKVSESDFGELSYLKLIIKETLRLHPPAPILVPRESREKCEIDGYVIDKGTKVIVNAWAMARDSEYWGGDAETFKPERFHDVSIDYKGANFEFIPFGAGKRICPGIAFAGASLELPLAQLLYHFDWILPDGAKPEELDMSEKFAATVGRKSNLYLVPISRCP